MTLEFHKLTTQIERMGIILAEQIDDLDDKSDLAQEMINAWASEDDLEEIQRRVAHAISPEVDAGYRGARPLDEPMARAHPLSEIPESATLIATDGSQILPNRHGPALYYLINTGTIIVHQGTSEAPVVRSEPYLFFEKEHIRSSDRMLISNATVAARRTVAEMSALAENAWYERDGARPLVSLMDGPLLFFLGAEVPDKDQLRNVYYSAMTRLMDAQAGLAGYIDVPRSRFVVGLLHLLSLAEEDVSRATLATDGKLEGLTDRWVFERILQPGDRSSLFVQMSPQNRDYRKDAGDSHEICFFYMNVASDDASRAHVARVEVPMWVAENKRLVGEAQALVYQQCEQLVTRYPYILMRADELAVVRGDEERQLRTMIKVSLTRHGVGAGESEKQQGKDASRAAKTRHRMAGGARR
jgi:hypothetical protein